jgi:hypothetical protein
LRLFIWVLSIATVEGSQELVADVFGREVDVSESHVDVRVSHEAHQSRHGYPRANHVCGEGVPKSMGVSANHAWSFAMMAKDGAQTRGTHRTSAQRAFEDHEEDIVGWVVGSFVAQVAREAWADLRSQGEDPIFVSLAADSNLVLVELDVAQVEAENFSWTQATEQHEGSDREISPCFETCEETSEFFAVERFDKAARYLDVEKRTVLARALGVAERTWTAKRRSGFVTHAASTWQGVPGVEFIHASQGQQPQIDGSWSGRTSALLMEIANKLQEMSLGELVQAQTLASHPGPGCLQGEGVGPKRGVWEASQGAGIEEGAYRFNLSAVALEESVGRRVFSIAAKDDQEVAGIWEGATVQSNSLKISRIGRISGCEDRLGEEAIAGGEGIFCPRDAEHGRSNTW